MKPSTVIISSPAPVTDCPSLPCIHTMLLFSVQCRRSFSGPCALGISSLLSLPHQWPAILSGQLDHHGKSACKSCLHVDLFVGPESSAPPGLCLVDPIADLILTPRIHHLFTSNLMFGQLHCRDCLGSPEPTSTRIQRPLSARHTHRMPQGSGRHTVGSSCLGLVGAVVTSSQDIAPARWKEVMLNEDDRSCMCGSPGLMSDTKVNGS